MSPTSQMGWPEILLRLITEWRKLSVFLVALFVMLPFVAVVVLFMESRGIMITPTLLEMQQRGQEHQAQTDALEVIATSIQRHLNLLDEHNRQSTRKDEIIAYLLLEDCEGKAGANSKRCQRLEKFIARFNNDKRDLRHRH